MRAIFAEDSHASDIREQGLEGLISIKLQSCPLLFGYRPGRFQGRVQPGLRDVQRGVSEWRHTEEMRARNPGRVSRESTKVQLWGRGSRLRMIRVARGGQQGPTIELSSESRSMAKG